MSNDTILDYIKEVANTDVDALCVDKLMKSTRAHMSQISDTIDSLSGKITQGHIAHISGYLGDLSYCMLRLTFSTMLKHSNRPTALFSMQQLVGISADWIEKEIEKGTGCDNCDNKH